MKRITAKTISNKPMKFIPEEYKDLDENAKSIYDRPIIFICKKLTREDKYAVKDEIEVLRPKGKENLTKEEIESASKVKGEGRAHKYIWDNCVPEIKNVLLESEDGKVEELDSVTGAEKEKLWNTTGIDAEIMSALAFVINESNMTGEESKN